jgi:predicted  nucleic acid-binding Zn-ribbon protein
MPDALLKARFLSRVNECKKALRDLWADLEEAKRALKTAEDSLVGVQRRLQLLSAAIEGEEPTGL